MLERLDLETENKLKNMYYEVEKDFENFPYIKTTEDFFEWREIVKAANGYDSNLRNQQIEECIKGNDSLELLYDWTKFYRMVDRAKAKLSLSKLEHGLEDSKEFPLKATVLLHRHLKNNNKGNVKQLFGIFQIRDLNLGIKYHQERTINTPYEFEKAIVKEEKTEPWDAKLFITLLKAYEISGEDLLTVGREVEKLGNQYLKYIDENYPIVEKGPIYRK